MTGSTSKSFRHELTFWPQSIVCGRADILSHPAPRTRLLTALPAHNSVTLRPHRRPDKKNGLSVQPIKHTPAPPAPGIARRPVRVRCNRPIAGHLAIGKTGLATNLHPGQTGRGCEWVRTGLRPDCASARVDDNAVNLSARRSATAGARGIVIRFAAEPLASAAAMADKTRGPERHLNDQCRANSSPCPGS